MDLGQLLKRLEDEASASEALDALGDLVLFARVQSEGAPFDETPGVYVVNAMRRFAARADDDTWLALMTGMERDADPAKAALRCIVEWALAQDAAPVAAGGCAHAASEGVHHGHKHGYEREVP